MSEQEKLEENKNIVKSFYEYYNKRDWEKLANLLHEDLSKNKNIPDTDEYQKRNQILRQKFMMAIFDTKTKEMRARSGRKSGPPWKNHGRMEH